MDSIDLDVVSILVFEQLQHSVESESWAEAAMALYKLQDLEAGQNFIDQDEVTVKDDVTGQEFIAA